MKRVEIVCGNSKGVFGFTNDISAAELKQLVRLEFGLSVNDELSLCKLDNGIYVVIPFSVALMDNNASYLLRVYSGRAGGKDAPVDAGSERTAVADQVSALVEQRIANVVNKLGDSGIPAPPVDLPPPIPARPRTDDNTAAKQATAAASAKKSISSVKPLQAGQIVDPENEAPNWAQYKSDEGHPYWFNSRTGESTWDKPEVLKTGLEKDSNYQAQKYYEDEGYDPFEDDQYFDSYTDLSLQGEMIGDRSRSDSYLRAMLRFADADFKDKVVLDCGCGTGLLSFFAIKAGAKKVYAIEGSNLAFETKAVVEANGLSDKIIVYHARMEDVELPEKVDTIVSEWMGACLIFESMLGSVLFARDKWLKPGGMLYPSRADILFGPIEAKEYFAKKIDFWADVYGVNMSTFLPTARKCCVEKPMFDRIVKGDDVLIDGPGLTLVKYDLMTMSIDEIERVAQPFDFTLNRDATLHGFACWFTVDFESSAMRTDLKKEKQADQDSKSSQSDDAAASSSSKKLAPGIMSIDNLEGEVGDPKKVVVLSTAPDKIPTHWKQLSLLLDEGISVKKGDNIKGNIEILRNVYWRRHFNYDVDFSVNDSDKQSKSFGLWRYKTEQAPKPETIPPNAL